MEYNGMQRNSPTSGPRLSTSFFNLLQASSISCRTQDKHMHLVHDQMLVTFLISSPPQIMYSVWNGSSATLLWFPTSPEKLTVTVVFLHVLTICTPDIFLKIMCKFLNSIISFLYPFISKHCSLKLGKFTNFISN